MRRCDAHYTHHKDFQCVSRAVFFVTYFSDGSGGKFSCAQHLAHIVRAVISREDVPERAAVTVVPVAQ